MNNFNFSDGENDDIITIISYMRSLQVLASDCIIFIDCKKLWLKYQWLSKNICFWVKPSNLFVGLDKDFRF